MKERSSYQVLGTLIPIQTQSAKPTVQFDQDTSRTEARRQSFGTQPFTTKQVLSNYYNPVTTALCFRKKPLFLMTSARFRASANCTASASTFASRGLVCSGVWISTPSCSCSLGSKYGLFYQSIQIHCMCYIRSKVHVHNNLSITVFGNKTKSDPTPFTLWSHLLFHPFFGCLLHHAFDILSHPDEVGIIHDEILAGFFT